jgi:hypothetical protein
MPLLRPSVLELETRWQNRAALARISPTVFLGSGDRPVAAAQGELLAQDLAGVAHGQSLGGRSSPATLPWRMPGRRGDDEDRSR